jgi:hypothetical protein
MCEPENVHVVSMKGTELEGNWVEKVLTKLTVPSMGSQIKVGLSVSFFPGT